MADKFKIGDVVELISGSLPMTVTGYNDKVDPNHDDRDKRHKVATIWFDTNNEICRDSFPEEVLQKSDNVLIGGVVNKKVLDV